MQPITLLECYAQELFYIHGGQARAPMQIGIVAEGEIKDKKNYEYQIEASVSPYPHWNLYVNRMGNQQGCSNGVGVRFSRPF